MTKETRSVVQKYYGQYLTDESRDLLGLELQLVSAKELGDEIIARFVKIEPTASVETTCYISMSRGVEGAFALLLADPGSLWELTRQGRSELVVKPA